MFSLWLYSLKTIIIILPFSLQQLICISTTNMPYTINRWKYSDRFTSAEAVIQCVTTTDHQCPCTKDASRLASSRKSTRERECERVLERVWERVVRIVALLPINLYSLVFHLHLGIHYNQIHFTTTATTTYIVTTPPPLLSPL